MLGKKGSERRFPPCWRTFSCDHFVPLYPGSCLSHLRVCRFNRPRVFPVTYTSVFGRHGLAVVPHAIHDRCPLRSLVSVEMVLSFPSLTPLVSVLLLDICGSIKFAYMHRSNLVTFRSIHILIHLVEFRASGYYVNVVALFDRYLERS